MTLKDEIKKLVKANQGKIFAFLKKMVACNSYSHNKPGIDNVGKMIKNEMPKCFSATTVKHNQYGDNYIYRHNNFSKKPILLVGHMDTLCPEDASFNRLAVAGNKLIGPGVNDMKGGLTVLIWSLKILERAGALKEIPITCIFNSDEEIGSVFSDRIFKNMRGKAGLALVFECGGPAGTVVTARKSNARFRLNITGVPNHFGNLKERKVSALEELAGKIIVIESLNRSDKSVAANVGKAGGGLAANAVAEHAFMEFEVRHWSPDIEKETLRRIRQIASTPNVTGCRLDIEIMGHRPAMKASEKSMKIFNLIVKTGKELGQKIIEEERGGLSDGNWLSYVGIPTIDGLGPLGDGDFTRNEFIFKQTLFDRIELVSNLLWKAHKEWH